MTKMFFAWPLLAALWVLRWPSRRALLGGAASLAVPLVALGWAACGGGSFGSGAREVLPTLSQGTFNPDNFSLSMAALRLARAAGWAYTGGPLPEMARDWLSLAAVAGPALACGAARGRSTAGLCSVAVVAAALCAPTCWSSYLPLALAPLAVWLSSRGRQDTELGAQGPSRLPKIG